MVDASITYVTRKNNLYAKQAIIIYYFTFTVIFFLYVLTTPSNYLSLSMYLYLPISLYLLLYINGPQPSLGWRPLGSQEDS